MKHGGFQHKRVYRLGGRGEKECVFADVAALFARAVRLADGLARAEVGEGRG